METKTVECFKCEVLVPENEVKYLDPYERCGDPNCCGYKVEEPYCPTCYEVAID